MRKCEKTHQKTSKEYDHNMINLESWHEIPAQDEKIQDWHKTPDQNEEIQDWHKTPDQDEETQDLPALFSNISKNEHKLLQKFQDKQQRAVILQAVFQE